MSKEKWIDDIIQSGKDLSPLPVNPFLATRVEAKLHALSTERTVPVIPVRWVFTAALAMVILLLVNVVLLRTTNLSAKKNAGIQQVMQEYGWGNNDIYTMNYSK
ncbi:hypothetical protein A3860_07060 [Niastella vici]|uniref:Uncharacterized protein n=1 Tax=Niastella vici TaxID=1703345 RepID=A0A1V9FIC0_9BACT|nr:hypothetical protein [Niastella vici]OQP58080.1 hypothetical protein A3860_07060 [Niastella vici]